MNATANWVYVLRARDGSVLRGVDQTDTNIESLRFVRQPGTTIVVSTENFLVRALDDGHWELQIFIHESLIEEGDP